MCRRRVDTTQEGFTLIEMMMGASIMAVVGAALVGALLGQSSLNATARNLTAAMSDATRIMEEIRQQNTGVNCTGGVPSAAAPAPRTSWDDWLSNKKAKTIPGVPGRLERIAVTCTEEGDQDGDGIPNNAVCGTGGARPQVSGGEWNNPPSRFPPFKPFDPIRVSVAVGWVQGQRVIGQSRVTSGKQTAAPGPEFTYVPEHTETTTQGKLKVTTTIPAQLGFGTDADGDGIISSQAMLTSVVTCR